MAVLHLIRTGAGAKELMNTASAPHAASIRAGLFDPRTLRHTLLLFVAGYLLVQPLAVWGLHRMSGDPVPFTTVAEWRRFPLLVAGLGGLAGVLWSAGTRIRGAPWRWYVRSVARFLAISTMLSADKLPSISTPVWLTIVISTAAMMGVLFFWMERWDDPNESGPSE